MHRAQDPGAASCLRLSLVGAGLDEVLLAAGGTERDVAVAFTAP